MPETDIAEKDIPRYVRRCWERYQSATTDTRKASIESLKMWLGGLHQWREEEVASRKFNNRPLISINRCKPAVDQVANEARTNPPGPQAHPVGGGSDKDGADILEGLIREYEYRSGAATAYVTAITYAAAGNAGVFELATEFEGERSMAQRIVVKEVEDPAMCFVDPNARRGCREDAMWAGKLRVLGREQVIEAYGKDLRVLNRAFTDRASGWIADAFGWSGDQATTNEWTGGARNDGPFYVCEFYLVKIKRTELKLYSDNIFRFADETVPAGVAVKTDGDGKEIKRSEPRRTVTKYLVTALDVLDTTPWPGTIPPYFWVLGPEIYIDGKLHRLSLIDGAKDAQRGLNYTATSCAEIVGSMTKSPWVGWVGQFDVQNADGFNPWEAHNTQVLSYLEVKPAFAIDPTTKEATLLPPPQRNTWEAPIARLLELATFFGEQIKAATSVFFDPSVQSARDAQSGEAIKALQSQTNIGTINWQDQLHRAVALSYQQAAIILPQICDGPRVKTIVRPDTKHEQMEINREFPGDPAKGIAPGIDPKTGKKGKTNSIMLGEFSLRVTAGPSFQTRTEDSIEKLTEVFKIAPQLLGAPGVAGQFLRMVGEGAPAVEQMADSLTGGGDEQSPENLQNQVVALKQQGQAQTMLIQKMQQALMAKLPEIESRKWIAAVNAIAGIREAEIKAGVDRAQLDLDKLEHLTGMAHDVALQAADQEHQQGMQAGEQAHARETQASDQAHATETQQSDQQAAAEQQQASERLKEAA